MASLVKAVVDVVFSTKKRAPFIEPQVSQTRPLPLHGGIVRYQRATLLTLADMPNHVHALIRRGRTGAVGHHPRPQGGLVEVGPRKPNPIPVRLAGGNLAASVSACKRP